MTEADSAGSGSVTVYVFERSVAVPIKSALKFLGDGRFEVTRINDVTALRGGHFWVVFRDATWMSDRPPQIFLKDMGCHVGQEFSVSTNRGENFVGSPVTMFPVSCEPKL